MPIFDIFEVEKICKKKQTLTITIIIPAFGMYPMPKDPTIRDSCRIAWFSFNRRFFSASSTDAFRRFFRTIIFNMQHFLTLSY